MISTLTASSQRALRSLLAAGAVAASLIALPSTASAQITFAGSTQFRIGNSGAFTNTAGLGGPLHDGLVFTGQSFNVTTSGPLNTAHIPGTNINSLGKIFLKDRSYNYGGGIVQMLVTLTNPTSPSQTFSSTLTGLIHNCTACNPNDFVTISWQPGVTGVPYTNGPGTGTYDMTIQNQTVYLGVHTGYIAGDVTVHAAPEPASLALIGTGLVGVIGVAVRRRKKA